MVSIAIIAAKQKGNYQIMKSQGSFLLRCWLIQDQAETERTIFDIEHVQTGKHERVGNLAEAHHWIINQCMTTTLSNPPEDNF